MKKKVLSFLLISIITAELVNGGISYKAYAENQNLSNNSSTTNNTLTPTQTLTSDDPTQSVFPISIYNGETDITFTAGRWGSITASISPEGVDGSNCIKYSNLENNPYSPGPDITFSSPKDISNMVDSDRLHLIMDLGTVPTSQPVRIIFNGDPSLNVVTPNLNKTSVFEELNLDISSIRAKLGGKITKMSFEGAGPNGWQGVKNLYVNEISIIRPTAATPLPIIAPVQPTQQVSSQLPISIYHDESNIYFNPAGWGTITGEIASEGVGGTNCIKYSNFMNNVYAPSPEAVFASPINITSMTDLDKLQISISLGNSSPAQAIRIIFNGDSSLNVVTPVIDTSLGFQTLTLDISKIRQSLGGQIAQMSFESAGPNGWNNVNDLYVDEINIVSGSVDQTNVQPTSVNTQNNPIVTFKSKELEAVIRGTLGKPSGNLYKSDVEKITDLKAGQKSIGDLSGIENLTDLQTLDLSFNKISDISALKGLTKLQSLNLNNYYNVSNNIRDISALKGLTKLQYLYISNLKTNDISALKGLSNLKKLYLDNYQFCDISVLKGLTNLQTLYLHDNQITDISSLKGLINLQYLYLSNSPVHDISPLKALTNLQYLYLSNAQISDISPLKGLKKLQTLYLDNNKIKDLGALAGLTNLQILYLDDNQVKDMSSLKGLINLQNLYLSNNQISDMSTLKFLNKLQILYFNQNPIKDITALKGLTRLKTLYLNQNQVNDVSPLKGLTNLQYLYLSNAKISDINPLKGMSGLKTLDLRQNQISSVNKTSLSKAIVNCNVFF